jgi:hypothetical protein
MFFIPLLCVLLYFLSKEGMFRQRLIFVALVLLSGMLVWEDFTGKAVTDVFKHYRLITLGMCCLLLQYLYLCHKAIQDTAPAKP